MKGAVAVRWSCLLGALVAAGCGGPPPPPDWPGKGSPATRLEARLRSLDTVRAGLEMVWDDPRFEEPERCRGSLSFVSPDSIRLRGVSAAFFTVFDLVAADGDVWLDVPREELTVFGERSDPAWERLPLSPRSLMTALLAHPCPGEPCLENAGADPGEGPWTGEFGELHIDPTTGLPARYVSPGVDPITVHWMDWRDRSGRAWPRRFRIEWPGGRSLDVSYGRVQIGRAIPSSRFRIDPDSSREVLTPAEAARIWDR